MRTIGQTGRHDEANVRFSRFCERAYKCRPATNACPTDALSARSHLVVSHKSSYSSHQTTIESQNWIIDVVPRQISFCQ